MHLSPSRNAALTNSGQVIARELVIHESEQDIGFSDSGVSDNQHFYEPVVATILFDRHLGSNLLLLVLLPYFFYFFFSVSWFFLFFSPLFPLKCE